jgi:uncharacterized membrane protein YraQ (UPF0718 family)
MAKGRRNSNMLIPTIMLGLIALSLLVIGYYKGGGQHITGLKGAGRMTLEVLPLLIFAFIVATMTQELISQESINKWVGAESGFRGILIGTLAGGLTPGGPFVSLPVAVGLVKSGAGVGTMVAFLTSWSLIAVSRIPLELGILGWKLTAVRLVCTFFFAPVAGMIAHFFFRDIRL